MPSLRAIAHVSGTAPMNRSASGFTQWRLNPYLPKSSPQYVTQRTFSAAQVLAREVEESVVERAVRAQDHLRADVVEDRLEAVHAQQPLARVVQPGDLQEIEVNVVRPGRVPLDAVVQARRRNGTAPCVFSRHL